MLLVVALIAFTLLGWYRGGRKNVGVIMTACRTLERVFEPVDKTYTNIGGVVGFNFTYELTSPLRRLEGTITTLPRHAVLYLPISRWLVRREDALLLTVYCERLLPGRGHIVEQSHYRRDSLSLEDTESMFDTPVQRERSSFLLLWYNPLIRDRLEWMLAQFSDTATECLRYLGYYGSDNYLAATFHAVHPELESVLREFVLLLRAVPDRY